MDDYLAAASAAVGTAVSALQKLGTAATAAAINDAKIPLQQGLLTAQQALFQALQNETTTAGRIRDLEKEIVRLRDWSAEKQNYRLVGIHGGATAYMLKPAMQEGEPPHWLCTSCFQGGHKSILQPQAKKATTGIPAVDWTCADCRSVMAVEWRHTPQWE